MNEDNTAPVRIFEADRDWIKANRGAGSMADLVHDLIMYYCEHEGKPLPEGARKEE